MQGKSFTIGLYRCYGSNTADFASHFENEIDELKKKKFVMFIILTEL